MRYKKIENPQGIEGDFYMDKKRDLIIPQSLKKNNHIFYKAAIPLLSFSLMGCPTPSINMPYNVSLDNFEQNGRYAVLDIGFDDNVSGNNAIVNSKIQFENAETPTQEAFDLFKGEDNKANGDLKLYENKSSKVLAYISNPGEKIRATVEVDGKIYSLEQMTNETIEHIKVPDNFEEKVRRKMITLPYFNTTTEVDVPSEGITFTNGILTEGALRGIWAPPLGSASTQNLDRPNDYTVYNISSDELAEFERRIKTFIPPEWIHSLDRNSLNAEIRFGTYVSLENKLNGVYNKSPFEFSNTYTNNFANLEYVINTDDSEEFNLKIRNINDFVIYFDKNGNKYNPSAIGFRDEENNYNGYLYSDEQKLWIKSNGEGLGKYKSLEEIIPTTHENYNDDINNLIYHLND